MDILNKFVKSIPEIEVAMIVSKEGLPIASSLQQGVDDTRMAAMIATLLSLAERSIIELEKGEFDQLYIKGSDGYLLVLNAGPNAVFTVSTTKNVRLGLIFLDCKRICEKIAKLISEGFDFNGNDYFPLPYIFKPPTPPGDLALGGQLQTEQPIVEEVSEYGLYCKHCGAELPKGQTICHACGKRVI